MFIVEQVIMFTLKELSFKTIYFEKLARVLRAKLLKENLLLLLIDKFPDVKLSFTQKNEWT